MRPAVFLATLALLLAASTIAHAQPRPPVVNRPTFSPYLNLLSNRGSPALNYFGLVRPQIQFQQQANQLQQQIYQTNQNVQNEAAAMQGADPTLPMTGRGATFGYYSHYFPTLGGGGGASPGGAIAPRPATSNLGIGLGLGQIGQTPQRPAASRGGSSYGGGSIRR